MTKKANSNLKVRTFTGVVIVILILGMITYNRSTAAIFMGLITLLCSFEYTQISRKGLRDPLFNLTFMCGVAPMIISYLKPDLIEGYELILLYICAGIMFLFSLTSLVLNIRTNHNIVGPFVALVYIGLPLALLNKILIINDVSYYEYIMVGVMVGLWVSDSGAYAVGRLIGRTPLHKRISPKKTIEGWIGGGFFALIAGYVMSLFFIQLTLNQWLIFMALCWFAGTIGDLYESGIKRQFELKDSGTLLPGHGGFLDRFDSFIFAAPTITIFLFGILDL